MRLAGHPIHPAIVHFPIAAWTVSLVCDIVFVFMPNPLSWQLGFWSVTIGVASGLFAMIAGLIELLAIPEDHPAWHTANLHMLFAASAWGIFVINLMLRDIYQPAEPPQLSLIVSLSAAGYLSLLLAGHSGAKLVYLYGVGSAKNTSYMFD